jgi:hypothetical protein
LLWKKKRLTAPKPSEKAVRIIPQFWKFVTAEDVQLVPASFTGGKTKK